MLDSAERDDLTVLYRGKTVQCRKARLGGKDFRYKKRRLDPARKMNK